MHDTLPTEVSGSPGDDGAQGQSIFLERRQGIRAIGPVPAIGHAGHADSGNEAVARLERLRKRYRESGDIAGAKYMVNAIRALRRGAE